MKAKEIREKTAEELRHLLATWREELFNLNVKAMTGQMEQYSRVKEIKRNIARALTILGGQRTTNPVRDKESTAS
jgi:large subunit ribosomal protein L29